MRIYLIGFIIIALLGAGGYVVKLQWCNAMLIANAVKLESAVAVHQVLITKQKEDFKVKSEKELSEDELIDILSPKYIYNKTLYCEKLTDKEFENFMPACQRLGLKLKRVSVNERQFA